MIGTYDTSNDTVFVVTLVIAVFLVIAGPAILSWIGGSIKSLLPKSKS